MAFVFKGKDVIQKIAVKFTQAFLPEAKKPYYLKPAHQQELDIQAIASKAEIYKIKTDPDVIVEGFNAAIELIYYLAANGFRIKTPLFSLRVRFPGEYDGSETRLPDGVYPAARIQASAQFRNYIKEMVKVEFDGVEGSDGLIAEAADEATGLADEAATRGNILTIRGYGLKIEADEENKGRSGVFFSPLDGGDPIRADIIAVNEPRTLKALVPQTLEPGAAYRIEVATQSSARGSSGLLKRLRVMRSDFTVTAQ